MKKIVSAIAAAAMLLTSVPFASFADSNPDLDSLAIEAGALNYKFPNTSGAYRANIKKSKFMPRINTIDYSMCIMTLLANKGIIKPSDIIPDAADFSALKPSSEMTSVIEQYAKLAADGRFVMGLGATYSLLDQKMFRSMLLNSAQNASKPITDPDDTDGYFMAILQKTDSQLTHAYPLVVIGLAEGEWCFGDKTYDHCVLTLDPAIGNNFSENNCLYMNSETLDFYFPYRDLSSENGNVFTCANRTEVLNLNGPINPSTDESIIDSGKDYQFIELDMAEGMKYDISVDHKTANPVTGHGEYGAQSTDFTKTPYKSFKDYYSTFNYDGETVINVTVPDEVDDKDYFSGSFQNYYSKNTVMARDNFTYKNTDSGMTFTRTSPADDDSYIPNRSEYVLIRERYLDESYTDVFAIYGTTDESVNVEFMAKGILISDTKLFRGIIDESLSGSGDYLALTASQPVMLKLNEETHKWYPHLQSEDGTFANSVELGDVNCDGAIDAGDASIVLRAYAISSTDPDTPTFVDERLGDFNKDGAVDAGDASDILKHYAEAMSK